MEREYGREGEQCVRVMITSVMVTTASTKQMRMISLKRIRARRFQKLVERGWMLEILYCGF